MKEKAVMVTALLAILAVGIVAVVGLSWFHTGSIVLNTGFQGTKNCKCEIHRYDARRNPIGTEVHRIRVKTAAQHTDAACETRCDAHYGKSKRARKLVSGVAG